MAPLVLTDDQESQLQLVVYLSSALSLVGTAYVLLHFLWLRWTAGGTLSRRRATMNFNAKLVCMLSLFNLVEILCRIVGRSVVKNLPLCQFQAAALYASNLGGCVWICCIAFNLYRWIIGERDAKRQSRFGMFMGVSLLPSIGFVCYHLAAGDYGDATFYCWLRESRFMLLHFYLFYTLMVIFNIVLVVLIHFNIKQRVAWHDTIEADTSSMLIRRKLILYIVIFITHRAPMMLYRILEALDWKSYEFGICALVILNMGGFSNSIVYGGLCHKTSFEHGRLPDLTCQADSSSSPTDSLEDFFAKKRVDENDGLQPSLNATNSIGIPGRNASSSVSSLEESSSKFHHRMGQFRWFQHDQHQKRHRQQYSKVMGQQDKRQPQYLNIFVSTFNMGEDNVCERQLHAWIPNGYEIYILGVQECMDLEDLQSKILHHLVTRSGCKYVHYSREIGKRATALGYHGYIALCVFVRQEAVLQGRFQMTQRNNTTKHAQEVCRGKSLLVFGRASNKGAVGMSFRYDDTSFAFVTCHLASDSTATKLSRKKSGIAACKQPPSKVTRRNEDAMEILQQLHLDEEDYGFGFPHLHHHSFILGDFNYRMTRQGVTPNEMLDMLRGVGPDDADVATSFSMLAGSPVMMQPPAEYSPGSDCDFHECSTPTVDSSIISSRAHLKLLLQEHDELYALRESKQLFHGFLEPDINFYPTFRRVRGHALVPHHQESFQQNYSLVASHGGYRIPSYTDRVLYTSLPGMENHVKCLSYDSCELVTTSDHKPVTAIFKVQLQEPPPTAYFSDDTATAWNANSTGANVHILHSDTKDAVTAGRMKDVPGTCEMRLRIEFCSIHWMDAVDGFSQGSSRFDRLEDIEFGFLFPLPCEDVFAQQRKLHEVADHLTWGDGRGTRDFASTMTPTSNFHTIKWHQFVDGGLRYHTMAGPSDKKHIAILLRSLSRERTISRPSSATSLLLLRGSPFASSSTGSANSSGGGSNSNALPHTPTSSSAAAPMTPPPSATNPVQTTTVASLEQLLGHGTFCVIGNGKKQVIAVPLTLGGKLVGRLHLRVSLRMRKQIK